LHNTRLPELLKRYALCDIYNCDETGLFWKLLATKTVAYRCQKCEEGNASKERITSLVMANMYGVKEPLYVIGKSEKPRCFKVAATPMVYHANSKGRMTSALFQAFLQKVDGKMHRTNRRVAAVLDIPRMLLQRMRSWSSCLPTQPQKPNPWMLA
jgi:hypothetical protein